MITRKMIGTVLPAALPLAALLISTAFAPDVFAAEKKSAAASSLESGSSRIKELTYDSASVFVIRTKYGYQTNIVFDPKEEIQTMSVGDRSLWQIIPAGNRLFIRPMTGGLSTNMTLLTDKRSYEFELKSVDEKGDGNAYVFRFTYPEKSPPPPFFEPMAAAPAPMEEPVAYVPPKPTPAPAQTLKLPATAKTTYSDENYQYTYSGPDGLAPVQVYDDGRSTFINYKDMPNPIPSAIVIGENGTEAPAPSIISGTSLVIDSVAGEIALRSDSGEVRIYNELINPR